MLYAYPWTDGRNWLHESVVAVLDLIHESAASGSPEPPWPAILPAPNRHRLKSRLGLRKRIKAYSASFRALSREDQRKVKAALVEQNMVAELLSGAGTCDRVADLSEVIRKPVCELFEFGFGLLGEFGVRDEQYEELYAASTGKVCPFCGLEGFDAPGAPREALDHYLAFSLYPFAGANLRNLVPIGHKCNSNYKLAKDVIRRADGSARTCPDPYRATPVTIDMNDSEPFAGTNQAHPTWNLKFTPGGELAETWDAVFAIRERYIRDVLEPSFKSWLGDFGRWAAGRRSSVATVEGLLEALDAHIDYFREMGLRDRAFLKEAMFRMLRLHCARGNNRLRELLAAMVGLHVAPSGAQAA
jgi:hypothetical protein